MKKEQGKNIAYALDGSILIALAVNEDPKITDLRDKILNDEIIAYTTEIGITEMIYILCRKINFETALQKYIDLTKSGYIKIISTSELITEAAKYKCTRKISIADSYTLALAKTYKCKALFAYPEKELKTEINKKPFDIQIEFLYKQ